MSQPERNSPESLDEQVDRIADESEAMDRPDRAIPLPDPDGNDEGVGPTTGLVP